MKRTITFILTIVFLAIPITASENQYSWYCKRNTNNLQPILPSEFSLVNQYDVLWLNNQRDNKDPKKVAYLTFDAGYENGNISKILDVLKEKGVTGAFFILENLIDSNPEIVLRMEREGHLVCNHTSHHKDMSKITDQIVFSKELSELEDAYKELTGKNISKYYRPPEGRFSEQNLQDAGVLGYKTVFWSFAYADWDNTKQPSEEYARKKILENMHNGAIVLLHPTSDTNARILGTIIDEMRKNGYDFGTLDELSKEMEKS